MSVRKWAMAGILAVSTVVASPMAAQAHGGDNGRHRGHYDDDGYRGRRHYHYREPYYRAAPVYYRRGYAEPRYDYRGCRTSGTTGMIVGGAAGALLGRELDRRGDRATGTIIGAGAGALVGREIARNNRC